MKNKIITVSFMLLILQGCLLQEIWNVLKEAWGGYIIEITIAPLKNLSYRYYRNNSVSNQAWKDMNDAARKIQDNYSNGRLKLYKSIYKPEDTNKMGSFYQYASNPSPRQKALYLMREAQKHNLDLIFFGFYEQYNGKTHLEVYIFSRQDKNVHGKFVEVPSTNQKQVSQELGKIVRDIIEQKMG